MKYYNACPLELVPISGPVLEVYNKFREMSKNGEMPNNSLYVRDYKRWCMVLSTLPECDTYLDIGIGMGQLPNAAKLSGRFKTVIGADKKPHSGLKNIEGFRFEELDLVKKPNPNLRADTVTCLEVLEHLTNTGLKLAIENLYYLAKKKLIISVPYKEDPLPAFHKQSFTIARLEKLFPGGKITLVMEGTYTRWVMVEVDFD